MDWEGAFLDLKGARLHSLPKSGGAMAPLAALAALVPRFLRPYRSYNARAKRIMEMGLHLENKLTKNITRHPQEEDQIHEGKKSKQDNQENTSIQENYVGHPESAFQKVLGEQGKFSSSKNANEFLRHSMETLVDR